MGRNSAMSQRLAHGQIGIRKLYVFPDDRNRDRLLRQKDPFHHFFPGAHIRFPGPDTQQVAYGLVHSLFMKQERHFINASGCTVLKNAVRGYAAEQSDLAADLPRNRFFTAADDHIRLNPQSRQLLDGMLRGFGFQLSGRLKIGNQRHVNIQDIFPAHFRAQLPCGFQKRQGFNVSHRAPDFRYDYIRRVLSPGYQQHAPLDFIGNMRDHLDGGPQILAASFP